VAPGGVGFGRFVAGVVALGAGAVVCTGAGSGAVVDAGRGVGEVAPSVRTVDALAAPPTVAVDDGLDDRLSPLRLGSAPPVDPLESSWVRGVETGSAGAPPSPLTSANVPASTRQAPAAASGIQPARALAAEWRGAWRWVMTPQR
jgi:hypothetical protein